MEFIWCAILLFVKGYSSSLYNLLNSGLERKYNNLTSRILEATRREKQPQNVSRLVNGEHMGPENLHPHIKKAPVHVRKEPIFQNFEQINEFTDGETQRTPELGFPNLGNTCFANSVHKLLSAHPGILPLLDPTSRFRSGYLYEKEALEKEALKDQFHELFSKLRDARFRKKGTIYSRSQTDFRAHLIQLFDRYQSYLAVTNPKGFPSFDGNRRLTQDQMDASEYLLKTLDALDYSIFNPRRVPKDRAPFKVFSQITLDSGESHSMLRQPDDSHFSLNIYDQEISSVADAFSLFFREHLEVGMQSATKKTYLAAYPRRVPTHFFVTLGRFAFSAETMTPIKVTRPIDISERVNLKIYTAPGMQSLSPQKKAYYPKAVIVHLGQSANDGHYRAYLRSSPFAPWILHDDQNVFQITSDRLPNAIEEMRTNGYVLLYAEAEPSGAFNTASSPRQTPYSPFVLSARDNARPTPEKHLPVSSRKNIRNSLFGFLPLYPKSSQTFSMLRQR
jgi:Ubiquitin carboxyl-terminal hydrolase